MNNSAQLYALDRNISETFNKLKNLLLLVYDRHLISLNIARLLKKNQVFKEASLFNAMIVIDGHLQNPMD